MDEKTNPFVTITTTLRGVIHKHSINKLTNMEIPKPTITTLMKKKNTLARHQIPHQCSGRFLGITG